MDLSISYLSLYGEQMKQKNRKIIVFVLFSLLISISGCTDLNQNNMDQEEQYNEPPQVNFSYKNENYTVFFYSNVTDETPDNLTYSWIFGDAVNSTSDSNQLNPVHSYEGTGKYFVKLFVSDGNKTSNRGRYIELKPDPEIVSINQSWYRDYDYNIKFSSNKTRWYGDVTMTIRNNGNIPIEIDYASIDYRDNWRDLNGEIYFSFTYTYEGTMNTTNTTQEGGFKQVIIVTYLSNNTQTLNPGEEITLDCNESLTWIMYHGDDFIPGTFDMVVYLHYYYKINKTETQKISTFCYDTISLN